MHLFVPSCLAMISVVSGAYAAFQLFSYAFIGAVAVKGGFCLEGEALECQARYAAILSSGGIALLVSAVLGVWAVVAFRRAASSTPGASRGP